MDSATNHQQLQPVHLVLVVKANDAVSLLLDQVKKLSLHQTILQILAAIFPVVGLWQPQKVTMLL